MSKVKEFIPPEVEFANDPMLCELHKMRLKIQEETKNMSPEEWVKYIHEKAKKLRQEYEKVC